jgi:hypothetical protein
MNAKTALFIVFALTLVGLTATSCGKKDVTADSLCEHARSIMADEEVSDSDCEEQFERTSACANAADVLACYMEAENEDGLRSCYEACEAAEEEAAEEEAAEEEATEE